MTDLNRLFKWLMVLSTLVALFVFLFSIVSPFYRYIQGTPAGYDNATYWSYEANHSFAIGLFSQVYSSQSWFSGYWFDAYNLGSGGMSWIPLVMFVMQALTLAFGCVSLVIKRRIIRSVPVCSSLTVLALMSYVGYRLSGSNYGGGYQLGYYLVYASVAMFALAFVLAEVRARYLQPKESKTASNFS